jgi:hypothetical protein
MEEAAKGEDEVMTDSRQPSQLRAKGLAFSGIAGELCSRLTLTENLSGDACRTLRLLAPGSSISARMA